MKQTAYTILFFLVSISAIGQNKYLSDDWERLQKDLSKHGIHLSAAVNQFNYDFANQLVNTWQVPLTGTTNVLSTDNSNWEIGLNEVRYDPGMNGFRVKFQFTCTNGAMDDANLGVNVSFNQWSRENYVLMPACAYNGNRFESRRISYSPKLYDMRDIGPDKPIIVSDIPRLNIRAGESAMSVRSGDLSSPVIGVFSPALKKGNLIHFSPASILGDNGVILQENRERTKAIFSVTAPVVRERKQYFIADNQVESNDRPANFKKGDRVEIELAFTLFEAERIQSVYDQLFAIRYNFLGKPAIEPIFSFSSCFEVQEKKFNTQNFVQEHGYYSVGMRETYTQDWAIGWTGGMISTYPLLFAGNDSTRRNVIRNFDWLFPNGISPSGFFWDSGEKGTIWYGGDQRKFHTKNWHIIRRSSDAVYFILKQFQLMQQLNIQVKESWSKGTQTVCDALVNTWETYGQMGQFVNSRTGKIEVGGSTSAAIAPAALLLAADFYQKDHYRQTAVEIAEYMYQDYITKGITCGGPADAMQNPDSESSYSMLESFVAVYEATGDLLWLNRAKEMAHQFATWVMTYNYPFPEESLFGRLNMQTLGTVWANTQNKHSAPGICTHSGVALLRLYRATGDVKYLELLKEIASAIPQYLSHPVRPIPGMKEGWMSERINTTDWLEGIGEIMYGSTWAETALMLTIIEVPGIYVVPEMDVCIAFDNIHAKILKSDTRSIKIKVSNPTTTKAEVKLLVENADKIKTPLSVNYLYGTEKIRLLPGEEKVLSFKKRK
ncbi:MAG: AGE family epimerase/isomerase [Bacteroidales bacterium]|nr:AGE family epimerase/isomerase [Bacteroidales bacterium]